MIGVRAAAALVPAWVWAGLALLAAGWWYGHTRYNAGETAGKAAVQEKWDAAIERGQKELERLRVEAAKVTPDVVTKYVYRDRTIKEKGDVRTVEIPVYVPGGGCLLPGGFRLFHDSAASGEPLPGAAAIAGADPVEAETVAATINDNYTACHREAEKLSSLWEWAVRQCKINPPPEGCPQGP